MLEVPWGTAVAVTVFVAVVAWLLWYSWSTRWVRLDEHRLVAVRAEALEGPLTAFLEALPASRVHIGGAGTWTLTVNRAAWWTIIPAALLFPLGLLFLLFRTHGDLHVLVRAMPDGTEVRAVGTTRHTLHHDLAAALDSLPSAAAPARQTTA